MSVPTPHAELLSRIPISEHQVDVLGSTTHYWEYGPRNARDTIVIAHGYRGDHHGFEPVIARMPQVRIIGPDLPGFGSSTPMTEAPHSIAGYARWLGAFIESLGLPTPPVVLGHSFGSMVSTRAIADGMPARALILVNPIATDPKVGAGVAMTRLTRVFYGASRGLPTPVANALLRNWLVVQFMSMSLATTDDPTLRRWIHEEHHRYFNGFSDPRTVAEAFDASLSTDVTRYASSLTMPVLVIAGSDDEIAPAPGQHTFVAQLSNAELVMLDHVGHLIHYEQPVRAADALRRFLGTLG